jgi:thiamine-monophosphate kinase
MAIKRLMSEAKIIQTIQSMHRQNRKMIGDDCAILPYRPGTSLLVSKDLLVEGVHFKREWMSGKEIGAKAILVNVSDIAAMGGKPWGMFLGLSVPSDFGQKSLQQLLKGLEETSNAYDLPIWGGDTTGSTGPLTLSITIFGLAKTAQIKQRGTARPHDKVFVAGHLGDAHAGLELLKERERHRRQAPWKLWERALVRRHKCPNINLELAQFLGSSPYVTSMMDLSDGLFQDLPKLCSKTTGLKARVQLELLPLSLELKRYGEVRSFNPYLAAVIGGEDYQLLFTVAASKLELFWKSYRAKKERNHLGSLTEIGEIVKSRQTEYFEGKKRIQLGRKIAGSLFHHFD